MLGYFEVEENIGFKMMKDILKTYGVEEDCVCHRCVREKRLESPLYPGIPVDNLSIIVCPICGHKRCPKASDHEMACTNSNDPGQPGSVYSANRS